VGTAPSPDPTPVIEHFGIFFRKHPKQSLCDVSLQMYYCASLVCGLGNLDVSVLAGLGEFLVISNEMTMKRTGNWGNTMASSSIVIA